MREIIIEGYTLLYTGDILSHNSQVQHYTYMYGGMPLCACREAGGTDNYTLEVGGGIPYIVNLDALRYYLTYSGMKRYSYPDYAPRDYQGLLTAATPYHIRICMEGGFSLRVDTHPLDEPIELYKVLPSDCLIDTKSYKTHPDITLIVKHMKYSPPNLEGEYINSYGTHVDTYIRYIEADKHLFKRESKYPEFYHTVTIGAGTTQYY